MLKQYLNKGISTPLALFVIIVLASIVGAFTLWQYSEVQKEETNLPEVKIQDKTTILEKEGTSTEKIDTSNWKTYRNEEYGFEIKYPQNLVAKEIKRKDWRFEDWYFPWNATRYICFGRVSENYTPRICIAFFDSVKDIRIDEGEGSHSFSLFLHSPPPLYGSFKFFLDSSPNYAYGDENLNPNDHFLNIADYYIIMREEASRIDHKASPYPIKNIWLLHKNHIYSLAGPFLSSKERKENYSSLYKEWKTLFEQMMSTFKFTEKEKALPPWKCSYKYVKTSGERKECLLNLALEKKNVYYCVCMLSRADSQECEDKVAIELNNPRICVSDECITSLAIRNHDVGMCLGRYDCVLKLALSSNNPDLCQYAWENPEECYIWFGTEKGKEQNLSLCEHYSNNTARKFCNETAIALLIGSTKNPQLCEKIIDSTLRAKCKESFNIDTSNWITYRDKETGFEFKYPEHFFQLGPEAIIEKCENVPIIALTEEETINETINGRLYNIYERSEGAAGSSYIDTFYSTPVGNGKCLVIHLCERYRNCGFELDCVLSNIKKRNTSKKVISTFNFVK